MAKNTRGLLIIVSVLTLLNSWVLTRTVLYARNTLEHHPQWVLGKALCPPSGSFGVLECATTRNLLAHDRLNLSVWHGCQEVLLNRLLQPTEVRFRFWLAPEAYLYVFVNKNREGSLGLRLSRSSLLGSSEFTADPAGAFTTQRNLQLEVTAGWHELRTWSEDGAWFLQLDDGPRVSLNLRVVRPGAVGFEGGLAPTRVDDVVIRDGASSWIREGFAHQEHALLLGLVCTLWQLLFWALLLKTGESLRSRLLGTVLLQVLIFGLTCVAYLFDIGVWSEQYPWTGLTPGSRQAGPSSLAINFERMRHALFEGFAGLDPTPSREPILEKEFASECRQEPWIPRIYRSQDPRPILIPDSASGVAAVKKWNPPPCRVLFLGTSQTWGVLAMHANERLIPQLRERLLALGEHDFWLINAAWPGSYSPELAARYEDHLVGFEPTLVVVNLGANDSDPHLLTRSLSRLVRRNFGTVPMVFFLEPNSAESKVHPELPARHAALRALADRAGLACFDAHAFLASPEVFQSGILWVDHVHPTSYGQARLADFMAEAIWPWLHRQGTWKLPDEARLDIGSLDGELAMEAGFYPSEGNQGVNWAWTQGPVARLWVPLQPASRPYTLRICARRVPGVAQMPVAVSLNGTRLALATFRSPTPETIEIPVPAHRLVHGQNHIELSFGAVVHLSNQDQRRSSLCLDRVELAPRQATTPPAASVAPPKPLR